MSSDLDYLRQLDHEELGRVLDELQQREWAPGERERVEAALDQHDPDAPVVVLPPVRRAA